ncbi:MAG: hypothetical protein JOZ62_20330 [Acidobacteriaceae bacterium]|nr:hypothetical protein [Acidobacteriaceae bacterium]
MCLSRLLLAPATVLVLLPLSVCASNSAAASDPAFWISEGDKALSQHNYAQAEIAFQKAIDLNPSLCEAHKKLAYALSLEGNGSLLSMRNLPRIRRAESELERAVELSSSDAAALLNLARLHDAMSRCARSPEDREAELKRAIEVARKAVAARPGSAGLHFYLANIETFPIWSAIHQAQLDAGIGANDLLFFPDSKLRADLRGRYGEMLEEAVSESQKALQLAPGDALAGLQFLMLLSARASIRDTQAEFAEDMRTISSLDQAYRRRLGTEKTTEIMSAMMSRLMASTITLVDPTVASRIVQ